MNKDFIKFKIKMKSGSIKEIHKQKGELIIFNIDRKQKKR